MGRDVPTLVSPVHTVKALDKTALAIGNWSRRQWDALEESYIWEPITWSLNLRSGIFSELQIPHPW